MTRILLVRHGQSTWNAEGRWQGWADPPLAPAGEAQARSAARHVGAVDGIVSSDLQRAIRTAEIISEELGIGPVEVYPGLRERSAGDWTGLTRIEILEGWPDAFDNPTGRVDPPNAEPIPTVIARAVATLHRLAEAHPDGDVLAVTHGGLVRNLERHLGAEPDRLPNLAGRWIEVDATTLRLGERLLLVDADEAPVTVPQQL